jgi:tight adherence protein C
MSQQLYLTAVFAGMAAILMVLFVSQVIAFRSPEVTRELARLRSLSGIDARARARQRQQERLVILLRGVGNRVAKGRQDTNNVRTWLAQAGFYHLDSVVLYWGARATTSVLAGLAALVFCPLFGLTMTSTVIATFWGLLLGWIFPAFYVGRRVKERQKQIQRSLPDALDMLVVCVEAGLGLNQALVRVAEEIERVSPVLSEQIIMVNLEIRAGTARDEALRRMSERTGVSEVSSLVAMMIQTDRFGTSIAHTLRVQATALRTKRRQRAEEAAAKTAIKLVFPLVLFIFPALFVVILGPAVLQVLEAFGTLGQ